MRGSAIRCVRSQCNSQWERPNFAPSPLPHPWTNFDITSNISLRPPRESMCKIWLESVRPLHFCACVKKHGFVWIFFLLTDLSIRFFVGATGHSFGAILMVNGSSGVFSQPLVPFGGLVVTSPHLGDKKPQKPQFWGLNRRFQAKRAK